jgi:hypothetical protein
MTTAAIEYGPKSTFGSDGVVRIGGVTIGTWASGGLTMADGKNLGVSANTGSCGWFFAGDVDSGAKYVSSDVWYLVAGGNALLTLDGPGSMIDMGGGYTRVGGGSDALPGLAARTQTSTGIQLASNSLIGGVAGVQRLRAATVGIELGSTGGLATNATTGFPFIPSGAGPPTGSPTIPTGMAALYYDSTNFRIYGSTVSGTWKLFQGI